MQVLNYEIPIDIKKGSLLKCTPTLVTEDADSVKFNFRIIKDEVKFVGLNPYDLTNTRLALVVKSDDRGANSVSSPMDIFDATEGLASIVLPNNMFNSRGTYTGEVQIYDTNTNKIRLTTPTFKYKVRRSLQTDEDIEADNNYSILVDILDRAENVIDLVGQLDNVETVTMIADLENLRTTLSGKPEELEQLISSANNIISNGQTVISDAETKIADVESRFNDLTTKQQSDSEVVDARKGEASLKAKIDKMDTQSNQNATDTHEHLLDLMPHEMLIEGVRCRYGFKQENGFLQFITEEVL